MGIEIMVADGAEHALSTLFAYARDIGEAGVLAPYELTDDEAARVSEYAGCDLYYLVTEDYRVNALAYGFLRGWDDGYKIPSLGIYIHPDERGNGLGQLLMQFLHAAARRKGARKVMLKMDPDNGVALKLYLSLGYEFSDEVNGRIVGFVDLEANR